MNPRPGLTAFFLLSMTGCPSPSPGMDASSLPDIIEAASDAAVDTPADTTPPLQHTLADGCDPLVPTHCGFPFPSDTWLVSDSTAPRGRRVIFGPLSLPLARNGVRTAPDALRLSDGFSSAGYLLTHMPGATVTGLADANHIERFLEADSPTISTCPVREVIRRSMTAGSRCRTSRLFSHTRHP